jgi:hypothetical protein
MADEPTKPMTGSEIEAYLEAHTRPRRFGQHYVALVDVVDEELQAQLALGGLGDATVSDAQRRSLAEMVADEVDWRFRLEPRLPPGEDDLANDASNVRAGSRRSTVSLAFRQAEALVLYEFLTRGQQKADDYGSIEDQAELRVLWDTQAMLESALDEPLSPDYAESLARARSSVRDPEG